MLVNQKDPKIFTYLVKAKDAIKNLNDEDLLFVKSMNRLECAEGEIEPGFVYPETVETNNLYTVTDPAGFELISESDLIYDITTNSLKVITEPIKYDQFIIPYVKDFFRVDFDEFSIEEYRAELLNALNKFTENIYNFYMADQKNVNDNFFTNNHLYILSYFDLNEIYNSNFCISNIDVLYQSLYSSLEYNIPYSHCKHIDFYTQYENQVSNFFVTIFIKNNISWDNIVNQLKSTSEDTDEVTLIKSFINVYSYVFKITQKERTNILDNILDKINSNFDKNLILITKQINLALK